MTGKIWRYLKLFFEALFKDGLKETLKKVVNKLEHLKKRRIEQKIQRPQIKQAKLAYKCFKNYGKNTGITEHKDMLTNQEIIKNFTLITFSYNTPEVVETMLKSYKKFHEQGPNSLIIFENSSDEATAIMLDKYKIPYIRNKNGTHPKSLDEALKICKTKYALVIDSDIIFRRSILSLIDLMLKENAVILGEVCGNRAGYFLYERVHPWFMLLNVEKINEAGINFHDEKRISQTNSQGFYQHLPIQHNDGKTRYYDVGSTFYEDINKAALKVIKCKGDPLYFEHYEGMSWKKLTGMEHYTKQHEEIMRKYKIEIEKHSQVEIKEKFYRGFNERRAGKTNI